MIAKVITSGKDRDEAVGRMNRALEEFIIEGVATTVPFHQRVMKDADFQNGNFDTKYVERLLSQN